MRTLAALAAAAVLAGCTTTHQAPSQSYRAKGAERQQIILGEIVKNDNPIEMRLDLTVKIDGAAAVSGPIGRGNGEVVGVHNGQPIQAMCNRQDRMTGLNSYGMTITCRVLIAGEHAATLTF